MKIKKHGKTYNKQEDKKEKFKCEECGCEFDVKEDEYYVDLGGGDCSATIGSSITYCISTIVKDQLVCSCPECHKICKKIRERPNDYYINTCSGSTTTLGNSTSVSAAWTSEDVLSEALQLK